MNKTFQAVMTVSACAVLAACGGSSGEDTGKAPDAARGTVLQSQLLAQATKAQIDAGTSASGVQALTGAAACNVDVRWVKYATLDPKGQPATATAGVFVPNGPATSPQCVGSRPVVLHAHGTAFKQSYNIANGLRDTTTGAFVNDGGTEGSLAIAMYAAQGFIVVAPNYLGYDTSSLDYHPFLNAEAQATDMVDGLRAAVANLNAESSTKPSRALLLSGVSQGGFVAMATHRAIQRDYAGEFSVAASAGISGPYNLVGTNDAMFGGTIGAAAELFGTMVITGYQKAYGDVYAAPTDVFQQPWAATIEDLLPTDTPLGTLIEQGKLPNDPTFRKLFGDGGLLTSSFQAGYLTSSYRNHLVANTVLGTNGATPIGWKPTSPVAVCGGAQDPTVFWAPNGQAAPQLFAAQGTVVPVVAYDLESRASLPAGASGDRIYGGFQQAKTAAGANVQAAYHGTLVTPFCLALARGFFQQVLAPR